MKKTLHHSVRKIQKAKKGLQITHNTDFGENSSERQIQGVFYRYTHVSFHYSKTIDVTLTNFETL